jgi:hypothetical protein
MEKKEKDENEIKEKKDEKDIENEKENNKKKNEKTNINYEQTSKPNVNRSIIIL